MAELLCQLSAICNDRNWSDLADTAARRCSMTSAAAHFNCSESQLQITAASHHEAGVSPLGGFHRPQGSQGKHGNRTA